MFISSEARQSDALNWLLGKYGGNCSFDTLKQADLMKLPLSALPLATEYCINLSQP